MYRRIDTRFKWDKGIDYEKTYRRLVKDLKKYRTKPGYKARLRKLYTIILLTQLRNGCRIREAIKYVMQLCIEYKTEGKIRVEKRRDNYERTMVTPKEITKQDIVDIANLLRNKVGKMKNFIICITTYSRNVLGFNTHSLRYAFITYLSRKGYTPQIISKITGHKNLDYIVTYTQKKTAEKILREL